MKKLIFILTTSLILISQALNAQTLEQIQMQNARATGYAIVASRNPGINFSILIIPWDGINSLEYNAQHQINTSWHAQAAVKGNYFYQSFDGNNFSEYSSVVLSEEEFDLYKSTGTQWWIVCSTLPPFSEDVTLKKGAELDFHSWFGFNRVGEGNNRLIMTHTGTHGYIDYRENLHFRADKNWISALTLYGDGSVGVGFETTYNAGDYRTQGYKFAVKGNIIAEEVKIALYENWSDFVFEDSYKLPSLKDVEQHIKTYGHLKDIPSAAEIKENGFNLGEMDAKLLQKIEELTLYTIEQQKEIEELKNENKKLKEQSKEIEELKKQIEEIKSLLN